MPDSDVPVSRDAHRSGPTECLGRIARAVDAGVDVSWHEVADPDPTVVDRVLEDLSAGLTAWLGAPELGDADRVGHVRRWRTRGLVVELYLHTGIAPEGIERPAGPASLQVAVSRLDGGPGSEV